MTIQVYNHTYPVTDITIKLHGKCIRHEEYYNNIIIKDQGNEKQENLWHI